MLLYFKGVEALGKDMKKPHVPPGPDDLLTICYTSGTTVCQFYFNFINDLFIISSNLIFIRFLIFVF